MAKGKKYWLLKSEPDCYSIDDIEREGSSCWDGVRNYQARNFMRDEMKVGDEALFYHSNSKPTAVVGVVRVCREAYPDHTAWTKGEDHFDPKTDPENPTWMMVDVEYLEKFPRAVTLAELKARDDLDGMLLLKRGMRLSIQPVEKQHFEIVRRLGHTVE